MRWLLIFLFVFFAGCMSSEDIGRLQYWNGVEDKNLALRDFADIKYHLNWSIDSRNIVKPKEWNTDFGKLEDICDEAERRFEYKKTDYVLKNFLTVSEFESLGYGVCDEWSWWIYIRLLKEGFNARWCLGQFQGDRKYTHAWAIVLINNRIYIIDQGGPISILNVRKYEPVAAFQFDKVWRY